MAGTKEGVGGIYNRNNSNLYHYSNNNPITYTDPDGRKNSHFENYRTKMSEDKAKDQLLGNSTTVKVRQQGCFITAISMAFSNLLNKDITVTELNSKKDLFASANSKSPQSMDCKKVADEYGLKFDWWTSANQGDLATMINKYDKDIKDNAIMAYIPYDSSDKEKANHWIGIEGKAFKDESLGNGYFVKVVPTSVNDKKESRPSYWVEKDGNYYIPTSEINQIYVYTKTNWFLDKLNTILGLDVTANN